LVAERAVLGHPARTGSAADDLAVQVAALYCVAVNHPQSPDARGSQVQSCWRPQTARTHHQQALDIRRRLAEQLGTAPALRDLWVGLTDLARTEEEFGNADAAAVLCTELAAVSDRLIALGHDALDLPDHRTMTQTD